MRPVLALCFAICVLLGLGSPCRVLPCAEVPASVESCASSACCKSDLLSQLALATPVSESCVQGSCSVSPTAASAELPLPPAPLVVGALPTGPLLYVIAAVDDDSQLRYGLQPPWQRSLTPQQLLL